MHEWVCCGDEAANHQLPSEFPKSSCKGMFKRNSKFDVDLLLYSVILSGRPHSAHAHSPALAFTAPLTSKYSEGGVVHTCAFQSTLPLAAWVRWCRTNGSLYVKNGGTFSRQTSYVNLTIMLYALNLHSDVRQFSQ